MLEKLLTVNWKLLFLTLKSMDLPQNSFPGQKHYLIIQRPKLMLMCIIGDTFFLFFSPPPLFDKEAAIGHPHFPLLFGSSIESLPGKMKE